MKSRAHLKGYSIHITTVFGMMGGEAVAIHPDRELKEILVEEGGGAFELCYQCGMCTGTCPWNLVRSYSPRNMIHQAQLGTVDLAEENIWLCLGCDTCVQVCPRGIDIPDIMRSFRRAVVDLGLAKVPDSLRIAVKNISTTGNPLGDPEEKRDGWTEGMEIQRAGNHTELLYFAGCLPSYDPGAQEGARATATVLAAAGVDFAILGNEETCCGEAVRKTGNEALFRSLAESNINQFNKKGVRRIVVGSPHCYHTFKHEYPDLGGEFEVLHSSQVFAGLIQEQRLTFSKVIQKRVIYHDSCYLGRRNGIYDEPREVLKSIPGIELIEFDDCRENSLCCGGGGGRVWMETKKGERFSDMKVREALDAVADVLAVACPYCLTMFRDSCRTVPGGDTLEIKDIVQLAAEAL